MLAEEKQNKKKIHCNELSSLAPRNGADMSDKSCTWLICQPFLDRLSSGMGGTAKDTERRRTTQKIIQMRTSFPVLNVDLEAYN